jgi:hypothetical protein
MHQSSPSPTNRVTKVLDDSLDHLVTQGCHQCRSLTLGMTTLTTSRGSPILFALFIDDLAWLADLVRLLLSNLCYWLIPILLYVLCVLFLFIYFFFYFRSRLVHFILNRSHLGKLYDCKLYLYGCAALAYMTSNLLRCKGQVAGQGF